MKRIQYLSLSFRIMGLLLLIASCENEIPYNRSRFEPKLTLNAFIYGNNAQNRMYLSLTGAIQPQTAGNSTVEVTVNGERKEQLAAVKTNDSRWHFVDITTRFQPGDVVRIDARTDDGVHHAWVEETVPQPVEILQVDTSSIVNSTRLFGRWNNGFRLKIRFHDRPKEKNYYRIMLEQKYTYKSEGSADIENTIFYFWPWDDIALSDGRPATSEELENELFERVANLYGVFDDNWFKDSEYTLNVQIPIVTNYFKDHSDNPLYRDLDVAVRLLSITEAEFYYLSTMNIIDSDVLDDYINDPVRIPGNVHGGNGFVGISSESKKVIRLIDREQL